MKMFTDSFEAIKSETENGGRMFTLQKPPHQNLIVFQANQIKKWDNNISKVILKSPNKDLKIKRKD